MKMAKLRAKKPQLKNKNIATGNVETGSFGAPFFVLGYVSDGKFSPSSLGELFILFSSFIVASILGEYAVPF